MTAMTEISVGNLYTYYCIYKLKDDDGPCSSSSIVAREVVA